MIEANGRGIVIAKLCIKRLSDAVHLALADGDGPIKRQGAEILCDRYLELQVPTENALPFLAAATAPKTTTPTRCRWPAPHSTIAD